MSDPVDTTPDMDNNISFIISNKAQRLLVLNENVYRCNKKTARKKYWKCVVDGCIMTVHTQVIEGGSDPVGSEYFYRIRHGFCRIPFDRNPVRISSEFDGTR